MGKEVEAHVAKCQALSLFRREESVDGDNDVPYTLQRSEKRLVNLVKQDPGSVRQNS